MIQRYCLRIALIVPVYLVEALLSFAVPDKGMWALELVKASYEAFALYSFLALMLAFAGGPASLVDLWESEDRYLRGSWIMGTCMHGTIKLDGLFLKRLVQGVIQFVIVRFLIVITVPILIARGLYEEGKVRFDSGWVYVAFIHNVSLWICLYSLWLFYLSTKHYLRPFSPALKFGLIKSIIFISFWQKIVLQVAVASNVVETPDEYSKREIMDGWNSFLLILECLPIAILNFFAFGSVRVAQPAPSLFLWSAKTDEKGSLPLSLSLSFSLSLSPSQRTGSYDAEWGSWRMLMEHGNAKTANAFPIASKSSNNNAEGDKLDEDWSKHVPTPVAALTHAINAMDVVQHALTTFSSGYGRRRYLALELSQRDSHNAPMTPLPESTAAGGHGSERENKGFGTFASP